MTDYQYFGYIVRGARQSNFLFFLALEILFYLIKPKPEIKRLAIFDHSLFMLVIQLFSFFLGSKPNLTKSEIPGTGVLKGVQIAVCGMHCINLNHVKLKILGTCLFCKQNSKYDKKFVTDIETALKHAK